MKAAVGELHFDLPQVREDGFRTQLFDRWQRSDKALIATMQDIIAKGVSTRDVASILEEMGGFEVSAATVSRTMAELDDQIETFFYRPLNNLEYPYLIVDARYEKVRKNGRVVSQAVLIVAGIRDDGRRELLALSLGDSESPQTWGEHFSQLKQRGLKGVEMVISDAHMGIRAAIDKYFQSAGWQRCKVHFMRELINKASWKDQRELIKDLKSIYACDDRDQCLEVAEQVAVKWEHKAPKIVSALRKGVESTLTVWDLPSSMRRKLNYTNMIERLMKELKKPHLP